MEAWARRMRAERLMVGGVVLVVGVVGLLVWASRWHASKENPIDYQAVPTREPTILTLTPERRTVLVVPSDYNGTNAGLRTCPEPPPDVAEALTTAVAAGLTADAASQADATSRLSRTFGSGVSQLFYRTQGAALFRDGTHALCLAWLNDIYKTNDLQSWRTDFRYLLDVSGQLIRTEVETRNWNGTASHEAAEARAAAGAAQALASGGPRRRGEAGHRLAGSGSASAASTAAPADAGPAGAAAGAGE